MYLFIILLDYCTISLVRVIVPISVSTRNRMLPHMPLCPYVFRLPMPLYVYRIISLFY